MSYSERLRILREDAGETRELVAKAVGVTERAIIAYELGDRMPRDDIKKKLASHYGKTIDYIFFND